MNLTNNKKNRITIKKNKLNKCDYQNIVEKISSYSFTLIYFYSVIQSPLLSPAYALSFILIHAFIVIHSPSPMHFHSFPFTRLPPFILSQSFFLMYFLIHSFFLFHSLSHIHIHFICHILT